MDVDLEKEVEDAIELMEEMESVILDAQVSYAAALNACAGVHGKIFTNSMIIAYGLDDRYEDIAEIVMSELDEFAKRIKDRVIVLVRPRENEPVN